MTFDAVAPGDVARVAEKSKNENLDARKKPYYDSRARLETSFCCYEREKLKGSYIQHSQNSHTNNSITTKHHCTLVRSS